MKKLFVAVSTFILMCGLSVHAQVRTWTTITTMEAEFIGVTEDGKSVRLRRINDGKEGAVLIEKLSKADQDYIKTKQAANAKNNPVVRNEKPAKATTNIDVDKQLTHILYGSHASSPYLTRQQKAGIENAVKKLLLFDQETKEYIFRRLDAFGDYSSLNIALSLPHMMDFLDQLKCNQEDKNKILYGLMWCEEFEYDKVEGVYKFSQRLKCVYLDGMFDLKKKKFGFFLNFCFLSNNWTFANRFRIIDDTGMDYDIKKAFRGRTANQVPQSRDKTTIYGEYLICEDCFFKIFEDESTGDMLLSIIRSQGGVIRFYGSGSNPDVDREITDDVKEGLFHVYSMILTLLTLHLTDDTNTL